MIGAWAHELEVGEHGRIEVVQRNMIVHDLDSGPVELLRHDRLEEDIDDMLVFFRKHDDVPITFVSPLWAIEGLRIHHLTCDILHVLDLGVTARTSGEICKRMLEAQVYGNANTEAGRVQGLQALNRRLRRYYRAKDRKSRKRCTRRPCYVNRIALKMLGLASAWSNRPHLKVKGAESRDAFPHFASQAVRYKGQIQNGRCTAKAALALRRFYKLLTCSPTRAFPEAACAQLIKTAEAARKWSRLAGFHLLPKHHMLYHLAAQSKWHGNPATYSNFEDESMMQVVAAAIRATHRTDFSARARRPRLLKRSNRLQGAHVYRRVRVSRLDPRFWQSSSALSPCERYAKRAGLC